MSQFKVSALRTGGAPYEEVIEAEDRSALYGKLRERGDRLVAATEVRSFSLDVLMAYLPFAGSVKLREKIVFSRNLSAMLSAGLALSRALSIAERQASPHFKVIIADLNEEIRKGSTLAQALGKHGAVFTPLFISMVRAGEESGGLAAGLKVLATQMEKSYILLKKIRGALIYPTIVIAIMIAITILMLIYVVPTLSSTFQELNVQLPLMTRIVVGASNFLTNNFLLFIVLLAGVVGGAVTLARLPKGKRTIDYVLVRIPLIGTMVRETNAARTGRTLASLLSAGVPVLSALSITRAVIQNSYYKDILSEAEEATRTGAPMSAVFLKDEHYYPAFVGEMISVGEETGSVPEMLEKVAVFYEDEVDQKTKDLSTVIEPFLMIFIGVGVGFFALAMIAPTYSLVDAI